MTAGDEQDWVFRAIVEGAPEAIIVADPEGVIRLWNAGAEATFGFRAAEALGRTLDLIIPDRYRERHWTGYRRVMETGTTSYGGRLLAVPAMRKDGARLSIEFHVVVLRDPSGAVAGVAAIVRDVTERWQRERALREQVQELERRLSKQ
jgi:PAS domain S-box-containing protein